MSFKRIAKQLIPPIFLKIIKNKGAVIHTVDRGTIGYSNIREINKNSDALIIIGNGPSLKGSIAKYKDRLLEYDCIAVNHFCETEYYCEIKPKFYFLADPAYFGDTDYYADWLRGKIEKFILALRDRTSWDLNLILPSSALGSKFLTQVQKNTHIHFYFYCDVDKVPYSEKNKFVSWDNNLIAPPAQTCLNTCVWFGIFRRYSTIYLIGADTSWIELLHVDQETNEVYTYDTHFYGKTKRTLYSDIEGKHPTRIYFELRDIAKAFEYYWELKEYADYAGVKIYNASDYSLIDAYERRRIE